MRHRCSRVRRRGPTPTATLLMASLSNLAPALTIPNIVDRSRRGAPVLPGIRGRRWALNHRTHSADEMVHAHSELVDAPIGLDTTFSKRNHRLIEAFDVVGQLIDTPRKRTHTPRKRTHDGFKPGEAF